MSRVLVRITAPALALGLGLALLAGCGGSGETSSSTTKTEPPATTATTNPDQDIIDAATALCESYGGLKEPGAVDHLLGLMTDDVVVTDTVLDASLTGKDQIRAYVTGDAFAGIDTMACGAAIARNGWVAGSYTLSNSSTGAGGQGIAAVHVTPDGLVDRQVNYYTPVESGATSPPSTTESDSAVLDYCHAWDDGADADKVLGFLAPDVQMVLVTPLTGPDAVRSFIENDFDFDRNDCGTEVVVNGAWAAAANTFTNTTTGAAAGGVNIVRLDGEQRIAGHYAHFGAVS